MQRRHVSGPATVLAGEPGIGDLVGGRYRIDSTLGYGGMAHVYRAHDELLQRDVAIKVFRASVAEAVDPKRTTREMQLLASMNHPTVVSILDAADDPETGTYLVMELVDGEDLGTVIGRGPLAPEHARRIGADVAGALEALHSRSIVHRDVKPPNILVLSGGAEGAGGVSAKLTDFGIAQMIDGTRITAPESVVGTAAYLSPEQVRGERVGPASDVYALGLVLLECLTGVRAFAGSAAESAMARLARPPAIPAVASADLADLLRRMTAADPAERPPAAEVAADLRDRLQGAMLAGEGTRTTQTPAIPMAAIPAAASVPLATGQMTAAATGGVRAPAPFVMDQPDGIDRAGTSHRRRLGMLAGLIGGFAALTATAALVLALSPTTSRPVPTADAGGATSAPAPAASKPTTSPGTRHDRTSAPAHGASTSASADASTTPSPSATPTPTATPTADPSTVAPSPSPSPSTPAPSDGAGKRTEAPPSSPPPSSGGPDASTGPGDEESAPAEDQSASTKDGDALGPGLDG